MSEIGSMIQAFQENLNTEEEEKVFLEKKTKFLFKALMQIETMLESAVAESQSGQVSLTLNRGDSQGWPSFDVQIERDGSVIANLLVGAEDRREAPVIFFKSSLSLNSSEIAWRKYLKQDTLYSFTRDALREFLKSVVQALQPGGALAHKEEDAFSELDEKIIEQKNEFDEAKEERAALEEAAEEVAKEEESEMEEELSDLDFFS